MSGTHHQALFTQKPTCARMVKPIGKLLLSAALVVLGVMAVLQPTPVMAQSVTASGGPTTGTAPLTVYFYANATGGMEPYTWAWDFGDGGSASSQNPIYSYSAPGTYTATVTVTDDNGSSATATVGPINVYIPVTIVPSATCGESDFNVCFSATTQGGVPPFTFDWNFGDGSYPTPNWYDPLPCHAFTSPNTSYNVTVTVHDSDGSVGYGSVALTTSPLVVSSCASPTNGNAPLVVQFNDGCGFVTGGIGPYVYDWDYGDGTLHGHDWKTQHSYNDPGTYHVTLTVTDECDPQSIVMDNHIVVNVVQGAVAATSTVDRSCGPFPMTACFSASASGGTPPYNYFWDFGDGSPPMTGDTPCHTYTAAGVYTVTLTAYDFLGSSSTDSHIVINVSDPLAVVSSVSRTTGYAPFTSFFTSAVSGGTNPYTYLWNFGDGSVSSEVNPIHVYTDPGYYTVTVTVTDSCIPAATATDNHLKIAVYPVTATADANFTCGVAPLNVNLMASAVGGIPPYTYAWNFGDGTAGSTLQNPSHSYLAPGNYTAVVTVTDSQSVQGTASVVIGVTTPLSITASADVTDGLAPLTVNFSGSASGGTPPYTYTWNFADGSDDGTEIAVQHTFTVPDQYQVGLTVEDACGNSVAKTVEITVYGPIVPTASANFTCGIAPLNVIFTGGAAGGVPPYTYAWNFGDGTPGSALQNPSHSYLNVGSYNAVLTVTDSMSHSASATVAMGITAPLLATAHASTLQGHTPLLVNVSSTVSGGTPPYTYDWDFGDGSAHTVSPSDQHTYSIPDVYTITLTVQDSCGNNTASQLTINVIAPVVPSVTASATCGNAPLNVCFQPSATGGVPPYTYTWNFGDGSPLNTDMLPCHNYTSIGTYTVSLTATDSLGNVGTDASTVIHVPAVINLSVLAQADLISGLAPLTVQFTKTITGSGGPFTYDWDFGDGSNHDTGSAPSHIYLSPGTYTVSLTVTTQDACGKVYTAVDSHLTITVMQAPTIHLLSPSNGSLYASSVTFQSMVYDNAAVLRVDYFANGSWIGSATAAPYTFVWDTTGLNGTASVSATVHDALGRSASTSPITITISNPTLDGRVDKKSSPIRIKVYGNGFQPGCVVKINGVAAPISLYKSSTLVVAKGGASLKSLLPKGVPVIVTVQNPNGGVTNGVPFTR